MRAWALALTFLVLAGCAVDEAAGPPTRATPVSVTPGTPAPAAPGTYETLDEIAAAFDCADVQDVGTGGNPGLSAFGICHIRRHNIDIYMTTNRGQWEHLAEQFPSVLGPNWIIVCPTGAEAARIVHRRLGGELRIPGKGGES